MSSGALAHPPEPLPDDDVHTETSRAQRQTETAIRALFHGPPTSTSPFTLSLTLERSKHIAYCSRTLGGLPAGWKALDASKPWLMYWTVHSLLTLGAQLDPASKTRAISTLLRYQHPSGGFGGGPDQIPHLLPTYAAVCALAIVGGRGKGEGWVAIDREGIYRFFMRMKQKDGSFIVHDGGEVDVRGVYCVLVVATLLDILTPELVDGTERFVSSCQTYEGGFAASSHPFYPSPTSPPLSTPNPPLGEAHGGYTSCSLASLTLLRPLSSSASGFPPFDLGALVRWSAHMQGHPIEGGGFRGRSNKLVDGCYSWWVGGTFNVLEAWMPKDEAKEEELVKSAKVQVEEGAEKSNGGSAEWVDEDGGLFDRVALQEFILLAAQDPKGGLRDKPGKPVDAYHTAYNLSGLSAAQHHLTYSPRLAAAQSARFNPTPAPGTPAVFAPEGREELRRNAWGAAVAWEADEKERCVVGGAENLTNPTHPLFNVTTSRAFAMMEYFYGQEEGAALKRV